LATKKQTKSTDSRGSKNASAEMCYLCKVPMKKDQRVRNGEVWKCPKCGSIINYPKGYDEKVNE